MLPELNSDGKQCYSRNRRTVTSVCADNEEQILGLTRKDLKNMAFQLAKRNYISNPFLCVRAGRGWLHLFMKRYRERISFRKTAATSFHRMEI